MRALAYNRNGHRIPALCSPAWIPAGAHLTVTCGGADWARLGGATVRRTVHVRNYPEQLAHLAAGLPSGELTTALQGARQAAFTGDEQAAARQLGRAAAALHRTPLSDARRAEVLRAIVRAANVWQLTIPRLHVVQVGEHLWAIVRAQLARDGLENGPTAVARAARRTAATNRIGVVLRPGQLLVLPHFS